MLTDKFGNFFLQKVSRIQSELDAVEVALWASDTDEPQTVHNKCIVAQFSDISEGSLGKLIMDAPTKYKCS